MTVQEYMAGKAERAAGFLAFCVGTTREDRVDWKPEVEGAAGIRSVLDLAGECIGFNRAVAMLLRGEAPPPSPGATRPFGDATEAQGQVLASAKEMADAVRGLSDEALRRDYSTPFGPMAGLQLIEIATNNMSYHTGQVNMIQLLYGDTEFRFPS